MGLLDEVGAIVGFRLDELGDFREGIPCFFGAGRRVGC